MENDCLLFSDIKKINDNIRHLEKKLEASKKKLVLVKYDEFGLHYEMNNEFKKYIMPPAPKLVREYEHYFLGKIPENGDTIRIENGIVSINTKEHVQKMKGSRLLSIVPFEYESCDSEEWTKINNDIHLYALTILHLEKNVPYFMTPALLDEPENTYDEYLNIYTGNEVHNFFRKNKFGLNHHDLSYIKSLEMLDLPVPEDFIEARKNQLERLL